MTKISQEITPPEWITKEFLQTSLRSGFHEKELIVKDLVIRPAVGVGDNYASQIFRITLDLCKNGYGPERISLVMKTLPLGDVAQKAIHDGEVFIKESKMFTETLPEMHSLLEEIQPGQFPKLFAKCYYHQGPPNNVIILEDLCASGFKIADRFKGLDLEHSLLVVESLAKLHASSYALIQKNKKVIEEYKESLYQPKFSHLFSKVLKDGLLALADEVETWSDFPKHYSGKLRDMEKEIMERMFKAYERNESKLNVIIHGDTWLNNMMFKYEKNTLVGMKFVDYQMANYNSPVLDLNYFIFTSPTQEVRDEHLDDLLRKYHDSLTNTLDTLKCNVDYSFEELKGDFFERLTYGFISAILVFPITCVPPEFAPDINDLLDNTSEYKDKAVFQSEQFKRVMKKVLPFFEKHGVI